MPNREQLLGLAVLVIFCLLAVCIYHQIVQLSTHPLTVAAKATGASSSSFLTSSGCQCPTSTEDRSPMSVASVAVPANTRRDRVLCWVPTSPDTISTRGASVNSTWLRRCDTQLFMSSKPFPGDPRVISVISEEGRGALPQKTFKAFKYAFDNHLNDSEWFMKADDDTYVVVENLKHLLSAFNPEEPIYLGHHFRLHIRQGYNSGGAGYVLSREALRRFGTKGAACSISTEYEDLEMGRCMELLGVRLESTLDATGRSRFHGYPASCHIGGKVAEGYEAYDANGGRTGLDTVSDFAVTFHFVSPEEMRILEYAFYHFKLFGKSVAAGSSGTER